MIQDASPTVSLQTRLGSDLVYLPRLRQSQQRFGPALFERLLTLQELAYCLGGQPIDQALASSVWPTRKIIARIGGRIAAKEATAKALGVGLNGLGWNQGVSWQEIEVLSEENQPPQLRLTGKAARLASQQKTSRWLLSLSHDGDYALATVIGS